MQKARSTIVRKALGHRLGKPTAAESELAAIVACSNDAIFSRTSEGIITTWNAAAERIFGYPAAEIIGHSSRRLLPPDRCDELQTLLARIRRGEVIQQFETERLHQSGRRLHVELTLSPVRNASGRLTGFSTIARDITEERQMRAELARREHELQDLFDQASVGLVLLKRDGMILRANNAFFELLNRPPGQVIGRSLRQFHNDPVALEGLLAQLAARQTVHNVSAELLAHEGPLRHVLVDANTLWAEGRFVHSRWFVRDISMRKRLEREVLELSERERRAFAQELHDGLGQLLGGIAYLSNVLRERLAERNSPEAGEAARIFGLVREAIEQTRRVSRGLSPIQPEPDGLMSALRDLAVQTNGLFPVRCRFSCREPVLIQDSTMAGHLYRIAQEAVHNALKHAKPRHVRIALRAGRGRVTLCVTDDGKGFGPIGPRRRGLGLHIMQYRAGLVRGTLTLHSRPTGGTEVVCIAPMVETKRRERHP
jgi:PAS domain S-box-containing protein